MPGASDWWRGCSAQLRKSTLVPDTQDKGAFLAYFTGFSARSAIYEEAVNAFGGSFLLDVSTQLFGEQPLFAGGELASEASRARELVRRAEAVLSPLRDLKRTWGGK